MTQQEFQQIAPTIPAGPGIYKYFDRDRELLYVGKAKSLRKRVSSYFNKTFTTYKTHELVRRIHHIEFTVVDSEQDAFLLENSLIKQFQPKFNISLKDDKSYPYIVIKHEPYPRVFLTRRKIHDGSQYLGPFTSVAKVRDLLDFVKAHVQLRTCKLNLTENNIRKKKFRVCLEYHLGNCKGPCEGKQTPEDYEEGLGRLRNLLRGNLGPVIAGFRKEMKEAAEGLAFEKAELLRKKIEHLENYRARSVIVSKPSMHADVFSMIREGDRTFVNYLMVENGTVVQTHSTELETHLEETDPEVLSFAVMRLRELFGSSAREIIAGIPFEYAGEDVKVSIPRAGDRKKLLELSEKNALSFRDESEKKRSLHLSDSSPNGNMKVLEELMEDLQLSSLPVHIECFDNSNFQGSYPVSAMVCFRNGEPSKKDYRHFNVKTVQGINDFATMQEAVFRRYRRLSDERRELPQLVIIDGGKGQLHAALEAIHALALDGSMTLIGLAKNEEEIFFPGDQESIKLPFDGQTLRFIRRIRDEVHRFGIRFHRLKRSKGTFTNELETIPGIGRDTSERLLKEFRSVKRIASMPEEELAAVVGNARARIICEYFAAKKSPLQEERRGEIPDAKKKGPE